MSSLTDIQNTSPTNLSDMEVDLRACHVEIAQCKFDNESLARQVKARGDLTRRLQSSLKALTSSTTEKETICTLTGQPCEMRERKIISTKNKKYYKCKNCEKQTTFKKKGGRKSRRKRRIKKRRKTNKKRGGKSRTRIKRGGFADGERVKLKHDLPERNGYIFKKDMVGTIKEVGKSDSYDITVVFDTPSYWDKKLGPRYRTIGLNNNDIELFPRPKLGGGKRKKKTRRKRRTRKRQRN